MSRVIISPSHLSGEITVPPSKSILHRNIICAALSEGFSIVRPSFHSEDIDATIGAVTALGATVQAKDGGFYIIGIDKGETQNKKVVIDCNNSGSTLRFLLPIAAALGLRATFIGSKRLFQRPIDPILEVLRQNGVSLYCQDNTLGISGNLKKNNYKISGDISSQFLSSLLFASALTGGTVTLTTPLNSAGYIDLTIDSLSAYGLRVNKKNDTYSVSGDFCTTNTIAEGDWSSAAFFLSAGAMGSDIKIKGLTFSSKQSDMKTLKVLEEMGAKTVLLDKALSLSAKILRPMQIDVSNIPDSLPILAVVASLIKGKTVFYDAKRLRFKESDRIKSTVEGLIAMGITARETQDGLEVIGGRPSGGKINSFGDHRIAMAFAILATFADENTEISDFDAVNKSYPDFLKDFTHLGGKAVVINHR